MLSPSDLAGLRINGFRLAHHRDPRGLAARIELDAQRLRLAADAVLQANGERR